MLTLTEVPEFLLTRDLVDAGSIVDGDFTVQEMPGRNRNFGARGRTGTGFLLKQRSDPRADTIAHEARMYGILSANGPMREHLPRLRLYDQQEQILVLDLVRDAVDLAAHHRGRRPTVGVASALGRLLAVLHGLSTAEHDWLSSFHWRPSALSLCRLPLGMLRDLTGASLQLCRIIQANADFVEQLEKLDRSWSATCVTHNDVRLTNVLYLPPARRPQLSMVDWEAACLGDPRWDLGSALGEYLSLWLCSIPVVSSAPVAQVLPLARCPLPDVQRAIRACWAGYARHSGAAATGVARFVAVRLVQTAFEITQGTGELTSDSVLHLQVAMNLLDRPQEGSVHLLGIPSPSDDVETVAL
jgi:aminoglycoside phosphotransferase (APT) family kinase protein